MAWFRQLTALLLLAGLQVPAVYAQNGYIDCLGGSPPPQSVAASSYVMDFSWSQNVTEGGGEVGIASFSVVDPEHNVVIQCRAFDELLAFATAPGMTLSQFKCAEPNPVLPGGEHASFSLGLPAGSGAAMEKPVRTLYTYLTWQCKDRTGALYEQTLTTAHELSLTCTYAFPNSIANSCSTPGNPISLNRGQISSTALPVGTACAASSFVNPVWDISGFTYSNDIQLDFGPGTVGSASFEIRNSGNSFRMRCVAAPGISSLAGWEQQFIIIDGMVWYRCKSDSGRQDPVETVFSYDAAKNALSVRQRWTCDGSSAENAINFEAAGTLSLPQLNCSQMENRGPGEVACQPLPHLSMPATLISPVSLGHYESPNNPTKDRDAAGCTAASQFGSVEWTVENINFTVLGDATRSKVNLTFDVKNDAIGYSRSCNEVYETDGSFDWIPYPDPNTWVSCSTDADALQDGVFTWFRYDNYTNTLGVRQEWYCSDVDPMQPQNFTASGDMLVHLNCKMTGYSRGANSADRFGNNGPFVPLVECTSMDGSVPAKDVQHAALPLDAVGKFEMPLAGSCTINSFTNPRTWTVTALRARYEAEGANANVSVSGYFSGPQYENVVQNGLTGCSSASRPVGDGQWRECPADEGGNVYLYRMERRGSQEGGYSIEFAVNGTWTCADRDPQHPIQFWGYGVQEIPVTCIDTFSANSPNVTECRSTQREFTVPISDLSWDVEPQGVQALPESGVEEEPEDIRVLEEGEQPDASEEEPEVSGVAEEAVEDDGVRTLVADR